MFHFPLEESLENNVLIVNILRAKEGMDVDHFFKPACCLHFLIKDMKDRTIVICNFYVVNSDQHGFDSNVPLNNDPNQSNYIHNSPDSQFTASVQ